MTPADDRVILLARDAWSLVAAWELSASTRLRGLRSLGSAARGAIPALRLLRDGGAARIISLAPDAAAWAVGAEPDTRYELEVGIATAAGSFTPLLRSRATVTPPAAPSPEADVQWVDASSLATTPVTVAWSGRRAQPVTVPLSGPRSSEQRTA